MSSNWPTRGWRCFGHFVVLGLIASLVATRAETPLSDATTTHYPRRPVQVVVPFAAGGGTDIFARMIQLAVNEHGLLPKPLVIVNQGGGSGTIGSRNVKVAKPDGYKILCLHEGMMTSQLSGTVNYGPDAFAPIAQTGDIIMLVVVRNDASYVDLPALLQRTREVPREITFGTNIGSPAHFAARQLELAYPGAEFNYVQSGGGQKRYALLLGGHVEVGVFSLAEFIAYSGDGRIRALAVLSPERNATIPDVPTALEQGIEAVTGNALYWWAPKGTPQAKVQMLADMLEQAMTTSTVRQRLKELAIQPQFRRGKKLEDHLAKRSADLAMLRPAGSMALPDFPRYVLAATFLLGLFVLWGSRDRKLDWTAQSDGRTFAAAACFAVVVLYVLVLQMSWLSFPWATAIMVVTTGLTMSQCNANRLFTLVELGLITGLGTEFLFTRVFAVVLP